MPNQSPFISGFYRESLALLRLSLPIIVTQLATQAMNFVDTTMAGRVGTADLAAIAVGASLWYPINLLLRGILMALTPVTAQLRGAGRTRQIGSELGQNLWLALFGSLLTMLYLLQGSHIMHFMQVDPVVLPVAQGYLGALAFGVPGIALFYSLNSFCEGMGNTRAPMLFALLGLVINIPANYLLIYGKLGLPALGAVGCGWATALVYWFMSLLMAVYIVRHRQYRTFISSRSLLLQPRAAQAQLKLGLPIGINIFICGSIFAIIALLIGKLGAETIAAHQIALNFSGLAYMLPLSLSFGITIRVGHSLGLGQYSQARNQAFTGIALTLILAIASSTTIIIFREAIAGLYTSNIRVVNAAAALMVFAACYQISDAIQTATNGVLRGYKDTRVPMLIAGLCYWGLALPVGDLLGLTAHLTQPLGAAGFWIGIIIGLSAAAILMLLRLKQVLRSVRDVQVEPIQEGLSLADTV